MYKEKELEVDDGGEDVPEDVEVEKDKELELELDVAEGFEKLYKTVEKDEELELYVAMTVKYSNSMILNLNDSIFSSTSG